MDSDSVGALPINEMKGRWCVPVFGWYGSGGN